MCGIIGGVAGGDVVEALLAGLRHLEYRGYDSAGVAVAGGAGVASAVTVGRVAALRAEAKACGLRGTVGIGHTRWATHGVPAERNAHPIRAGKIFVVHNGIIENHESLREELRRAGCAFAGETDTETVAHCIDQIYRQCGCLLQALRQTRRRLEGAYALAIMAEEGGEIVFMRHGSPLLAGKCGEDVYIASDIHAMAGEATEVAYLHDGEYGKLSAAGMELYAADDSPLPAAWQPANFNPVSLELGEYRHFMQKEIFEQPEALAATIAPFVGDSRLPMRRFGTGATAVFRRAKFIHIVACGTSYHTGMVARYWLEEMGIPCQVDIASEYRYRKSPLASSSLVIFISQSGETADTLSALRLAKATGSATLAVVNVRMSTMTREADYVLYTDTGPEIGVASTKAFTSQLAILWLLSLAIARVRGVLPAAEEESHLRELRLLPNLLRKALMLEEQIREWADELALAKSAIFVGRQTSYPLALEGALKLKEVSYVHAEGCAAGELKHGTLALVDQDMPIIGLALDGALRQKIAANLSEIESRGGGLYIIANQEFTFPAARLIRLDGGNKYLSPIVSAVPLQLLAYHTALKKGTDIDKPRNLAKSVTVE